MSRLRKCLRKTMSIVDNMILTNFELATDIPGSKLPKIKALLEDSTINPREIKSRLAFEIAKTYHGDSEAKKAEEEFNRVFREKSLQAKCPSITTIHLLVKFGL